MAAKLYRREVGEQVARQAVLQRGWILVAGHGLGGPGKAFAAGDLLYHRGRQAGLHRLARDIRAFEPRPHVQAVAARAERDEFQPTFGVLIDSGSGGRRRKCCGGGSEFEYSGGHGRPKST